MQTHFNLDFKGDKILLRSEEKQKYYEIIYDILYNIIKNNPSDVIKIIMKYLEELPIKVYYNRNYIIVGNYVSLFFSTLVSYGILNINKLIPANITKWSYRTKNKELIKDNIIFYQYGFFDKRFDGLAYFLPNYTKILMTEHNDCFTGNLHFNNVGNIYYFKSRRIFDDEYVHTTLNEEEYNCIMDELYEINILFK